MCVLPQRKVGVALRGGPRDTGRSLATVPHSIHSVLLDKENLGVAVTHDMNHANV